MSATDDVSTARKVPIIPIDKVLQLRAGLTVSSIIVEHRDPLSRFGSEYTQAALAAPVANWL